MNLNSQQKFTFAVCLTAFGLCCTNFLDAQGLPRSNRIASGKFSKKPTSQFLRVKNDEFGNPVSMQTSITRYRPKNGDLVIDLIGAVHIGEKSYYQKLNRQFDVYDVVLYELVAPKGTRIPKGGKRENSSASPLSLVSWMQDQAKSSLGLESQLERIDYQKSNLVHADLSPTEMGEKMSERGDTALTVGLSAMAEILRNQNKAAISPEAKQLQEQLANESIFELLNDPVKLKRMMASQFATTGAMDTGLGPTLNQLLIDDRNAAAIKEMKKQISAGKKKIAIFYGAAHMPDFEKRLIENFELDKTKQVWVDAWDLTKSNVPRKSDPTMDLLIKLFDELGR